MDYPTRLCCSLLLPNIHAVEKEVSKLKSLKEKVRDFIESLNQCEADYFTSRYLTRNSSYLLEPCESCSEKSNPENCEYWEVK